MDTIYLDHAATTPLRPEVRAAMEPFLGTRFGNPSSTHRWGRAARTALEEARERIAAALGASAAEVVFTSGGTESDNLAVLGCWRARHASTAVVLSAVEHPAVNEAARQAAREGAELVILGVDEQGRVAADAALEALSARPAVVSVMWGNNEVGTLQPVRDVAAACRERGVPFHTDAVQAFGKARIRVAECGCDLLSVSGHKLGGPMGVGALFIRDGLDLAPLGFGGGQQRARRPGTEAVAAAVGLARAAELADAEVQQESRRLAELRDALEERVTAALPGVTVNGAGAPRLPHIASINVTGTDGEALLIGLDLAGLAVSGGSACHSGSFGSSPVIAAMGRARQGEASVRFSLGRTTTAAEIEAAAERFAAVVRQLREVAAALP
ncbi:MAG: cysteine desulfurase [Gemmatimonadetes bacterium]|nr:cysteine desulfurase [Gemmatimonadota bacterium]